ncbi:unnamed protein product, partial [Didymodactylos carnosus]
IKHPVNQGEFNNKFVYNYSYRALSLAEENLLAKGWKYAINLNKFNNLNIKADTEYMYHCMGKNSLLKNSDKANRVKILLNDFGDKLKKKVDKEIPNLNSEELNAISTLLKEHSLVNSKVDKGNAIVVTNKSAGFKLARLFVDTCCFEKIKLNSSTNIEIQLLLYAYTEFGSQFRRTDNFGARSITTAFSLSAAVLISQNRFAVLFDLFKISTGTFVVQ